MRVLIIDDSSAMRLLLCTCVEAAGFEVAAETDAAEEGIDLYKMCQPDLVILDITLPKMNGIECLKIIKEIDGNAKVLMCSAMGLRTEIIKAKKIGIVDFIIKPFEQEDMIDMLQKIAEVNM